MWVIKQNENMIDAIGIECNMKKVLSLGPNRTVEVWPNSLADLNVWWVTSLLHSESMQNNHELFM